MLATSSVAIDIGSTAVRAVWLKGSRGSLQVVKAVRVEREPDDEVMLGEFAASLRNNKVPLSGLILGVSGEVATLRYNLIPPVPDWRLDMIMKYETQEIAEKSGEDLSFDFRKLDLPESDSEDQVVLVGLGKEQYIQPQIEELEKGGGRVSLALPHALGIYHAYLASQAKAPNETVLIADVGAAETHIVLVTDGRLVFARTVKFGGREFDEAIASSLGVRPEQAQKVKEKFSTGGVPSELAGSAESAVRSALGQLNSILQSSITFCRAQTKIPDIRVDRLMVSGSTSRLPQLPAFLEDQFGVPVERFEPSLGGEALPGGAEEWLTAIGLAASRMDSEGRVLDLLPAAARVKREFRERTRFLYAAAGILVVALLATIATGFVANSEVEKQTSEIKGWTGKVEGWQKEQRQAKVENSRIREQQRRLDREVRTAHFTGEILAAIEERMPPAISLKKLDTQRQEKDGRVYLTVKMTGLADNSERIGIEHLSAFQKSLEELPTVKRVVLGPPALKGGSYEFELLASPDEEPMPEGRGGRRKANSKRGRW